MFRRLIAPLVLVAVMAAGCVAGIKQHTAPVVGSPNEVYRTTQIGTEGQDGPKLIVAILEKCNRDGENLKDCVKVGEWVASGDSVTLRLVGNAVPAAFLAGGMVGAAAVLPQTKINQGGASSTANPTTTANSGSQTTGTVTGGSTVTGPNVGK